MLTYVLTSALAATSNASLAALMLAYVGASFAVLILSIIVVASVSTLVL